MEKRRRLPLKIRIFNTIVSRRERGKLPPRECKYRLRVRHEADCASHKLMECGCRAKVWLIYRRRPPCGVQLSEHTPLRHYWHWLGDKEETARKLGSPFFVRQSRRATPWAVPSARSARLVGEAPAGLVLSPQGFAY